MKSVGGGGEVSFKKDIIDIVGRGRCLNYLTKEYSDFSLLKSKIIATSMERGANTPNTRSIFHFPDILPP